MIKRLGRLFRNPAHSTPAPAGETRDGDPDGVVADGVVADNPAALEAIEERLRRFRQGLAERSASGRADWPPQYADPFPGMKNELPEIQAHGLTEDVLGGAVAHHGALIIRGLFTPEQVSAAREMQDRVRALSSSKEADPSGWYVPFDGGAPRRQRVFRKRVEGLGGNWLVDSPLGLKQTLGQLEAAGIIPLVSQYFGERPAISLQKCTLRMVKPQPEPTGWHQDGSFLGEQVRSMNLWVALSECGGSSPAGGMQIIPTRFEELFHAPPELGATSSVLEKIDELIEEHSLSIPYFAPGDAIMFDEKLLHRTDFGEHHTKTRYALECWFFAPSHWATGYDPLMV